MSAPLPWDGMMIAVGVANLRSIAVAFGEDAAVKVYHRVGERLRAALGTSAVVETSELGDHAWHLTVDEIPPRFAHICAEITLAPVSIDGRHVHAVLAESYRDTQANVRAEPGWIDRYRGDMSLAGETLKGVSRGEALLAWQAIHDAGEADRVLYYECLLRCVDQKGGTGSPATGIKALERLGLIRALDRIMVLRVLQELEAAPGVQLGVNISAQSAVCDFWWSDIFPRLVVAPSLASRLVLEITETSGQTSVSDLIRFADRIRNYGCRIALDDFGTGYASVRQLLAIRPDIVKIDAMFLRRAQCSARERVLLHHLVGLAASVAGTVTIEGVESEAQSVLAREAGAYWQQGYFFGRPSTMRAWSRPSSVEDRVAALNRFGAAFTKDLSGAGAQAEQPT